MRIRKRGLFLILMLVLLTLFSFYKVRRGYVRSLVKREIEPEKTTPTSPFCRAKRYYQLKEKLVPIVARLAQFIPSTSDRSDYRISNDYNMAKVFKPFVLESFDSDDWRTLAIELELGAFKGKKLDRDLFQSFLSTVSKEKNWKHNYLFGHFKIEGGELLVKDFTRQHPWFNEVCFALLRVLEHGHLPDMEFIVSMHDSLEHDSLQLNRETLKKAPVPIFVFSKKKGSSNLLLIPDHEMLSGYEALETLVSDPKRQIAWQAKKAKAFWRGATTSGDYTLASWKTFPRSRLIVEAVQAGEALIDAKFSFLTSSAKSNESFCDFCSSHNITSSFVKVEDHLGYKFLIDIDGSASTYSRFYWILRSNTMALKVKSSFTQWYYPGLIDNVHYLPVQGDLSNLQTQVLWAKDHDREAELIADNGSDFAKEYLSDDGIYSYLHHLLLSYSELLATD